MVSQRHVESSVTNNERVWPESKKESGRKQCGKNREFSHKQIKSSVRDKERVH